MNLPSVEDILQLILDKIVPQEDAFLDSKVISRMTKRLPCRSSETFYSKNCTAYIIQIRIRTASFEQNCMNSRR